MEPRLSDEERIERERLEEEAALEKFEREWESWGESPEQLAAQQAFLATMGPEG